MDWNPATTPFPGSEAAEMLGFIVFGFWANQYAGGRAGRRWSRAFLPGRGIYYAGLLAMLLGLAFYGGWGVMAGASFTLWRLPGWYGALDAGTVAPTPDDPRSAEIIFGVAMNGRLRDFIVMSARGLVAFPVFVAAAWRLGSASPLIALCVAALVVGAVYDLTWRRLHNNTYAEAGAGIVWGLAYWWLLAEVGVADGAW